MLEEIVYFDANQMTNRNKNLQSKKLNIILMALTAKAVNQ